MRNVLLILLALTLCLSSCTEKIAQPGEDCSIKLPGILFAKSLHNATKNAIVENDRIIFKSDAKTDYFNDIDGKLYNNAPILLTQVDNTKPFTLMAKVTPSFHTTYDAGALYIFSNDQLWQKFAFEQDEQGRRRIVSVRTIETSDDNNHDIITQQSVYLKISSDTKTVAMFYSTDNTIWNLARLYKNNYPESISLGISSQSPMGDGNVSYFEECSLTDKSVKDFRAGI